MEIWDETTAQGVQSYLEKLSIDPDNVQMAVIIQEMINPSFSGVVFSRNPMTGTSEIVIEGVVGEGTALVQDGITPERWIHRSGSWNAKPEKGEIPEEVVKVVLVGAKKIMKKFPHPIDLEWVYDGNKVYWVQMREITTIKDLNIYSNRISKDVMPGMIHPLIWSTNVPLINGVWLGLLEEIVGKLPIQSDDLAKAFFYRSYFNMGAFGEVFNKIGFPSEALEQFMGLIPGQKGIPAFKFNLKMFRLVPRLIRFINDKWHFQKKIKSDLPEFQKAIRDFPIHPEPEMPLEKQVRSIDQLNQQLKEIVYFNVVTPLLATLYSRFLEKQLKKLDIDYRQFNLYENMPELDEYNPNTSLEKLHQLFIALPEKTQESLYYIENIADLKTLDAGDFHKAIHAFLERFGHISTNSNNFMAVPWREDLPTVIKMISEFQPVEQVINGRIGFDDLKIKGIRKVIIRFFYKRSRQFTLYQEKVSRHYVFGYGLFRPYFMNLAKAMTGSGWLIKKEDIFYLTWSEIKQFISNRDPSSIQETIATRKEEMKAYQDVLLPELIYGDTAPPVFSGSFERMYGTPTSQGYYSGEIKIVKDFNDFANVVLGDVIVIPYSDVGWTPLFTRAGAVIAESGGLLSHTSIIAREYHIPAIVSVSNCMHLKNHQKVSVNGYTGEIILLDVL
jgi:pyruvate,water dikinase